VRGGACGGGDTRLASILLLAIAASAAISASGGLRGMHMQGKQALPARNGPLHHGGRAGSPSCQQACPWTTLQACFMGDQAQAAQDVPS
jgi:hypothetical protein